ncbi:MAG: putative DNA binding domain-containing protein, partial [Muribaculaceae bacterium]|nr:putative DNA binding domain-containing protein [Muribaculaceae bacterium]
LQIPESQNIEFKESWRDEYLKWVCGFANANGGHIYIGVIDGTREIAGVADSKRLMEDIPNKIVTNLGIVADVNLKQTDGLDYIEINVSPSNIPISYKGVYHYRSGSTKQELKGTALQDFLLKKLGKTWDDISLNEASINDIDREAIEYFLQRGIAAQRIPETLLTASTEEILTSLQLIDERNKLKNAAILLFGKNPAKYFHSVEFKIGRFGQDESDLIVHDVISGNIIQMADKVVDVLRAKYLVSPVHFEGMQRYESLEIPLEALREILYNAIAHKNYMGPAIQMHVYDDRIEIWNDGMLPDGYTADTLYANHPSRPRNPRIAGTMFKAGFIDTWGRGYNKIYSGFKKSGLPIPTVADHFGGVQIVIERTFFKHLHKDVVNDVVSNVVSNVVNDGGTATQKKKAERYKSIAELIKVNSFISAAQLSEKLAVAHRTIQRDFADMHKTVTMIREGDKNLGRWIILE